MKKEEKDLLKFTIKVTKKSLNLLKKNSSKKYNLSKAFKKEFKSKIDIELNKFLRDQLKTTNLKIFSEEEKTFNFFNLDEYIFVVDPLDGTFNYVRNISNSAISIALMKKEKLIFGVIGTFPQNDIYWGGKTIGAYKNNKKIRVSKNISDKESIITTGFPARFNFKNKNISMYFKKISRFAKVRMFGSAAYSLVLLAEGKVDYYFEENIMLWDVAAGLAICEGASGKVKSTKSKIKYSYIIHVSNGGIKFI